MILPIETLCVDGGCLSRVDHASMTDQVLMELLVSNIANLSELTDASGDFLVIADWNGIALNDANEVVEIDFSKLLGFGLFGDSDDEDEHLDERKQCTIGPGGSINIQWIPRCVTDFEINGLSLNGTIETSELPSELLSLEISENKFSGTFDMENLPPHVKYICIDHNTLQGTLNIPCAPASLLHFDAKNNQFSGSLDLTALPKRILYLNFNMNQFSGELDLSCIPYCVRVLEVKDNFFAQEKLIVRNFLKLKFQADIQKFGEIVDQNGKPLKGF